MRTKIKQLLATQPTGQTVTVQGWVRTFRNNQFIAINDGSTIQNIQAVVDFNSTDESLLKRLTTGACVSVTGSLIESPAKGQPVEVKVNELVILGDCDSAVYPLQPKKHSMEFLRERAHLRARTSTFGAIFRIRHNMAFAVHKFFHERGFLYLHTPIITSSDAEGAGEMFRVTTLDLSNAPYVSDKFSNTASIYYRRLIDHVKDNSLDDLRNKIESLLRQQEKSLTLEKLVLADSGLISELWLNKEKFRHLNDAFEEFFQGLKRTNFFDCHNDNTYLPKWLVELINPTRAKSRIAAKHLHSKKANIGEKGSFAYLSISFYNFAFIDKELRADNARRIDYSKDFFGKSTNLTVSGQLEGETYAMALGDIYTFGPTFRAENSNTTRHLAEFWMIEPEMAFYTLQDNMQLAQEFLQYLVRYALENCADDLDFLNKRAQEEEASKPQDQRSELGLIDRLKFVSENDFQRLSYTEAIDILRNSTPNKKKKFQYIIEQWGSDLQSEHERFLVEKHFKKPVILYNYPKDIKSFYMRQNEDGKTVAAMDVLFPGIGEIIGGSQREERYDLLVKRINELGLPEKELWWYLDLRKFGSAPHAGFGLGFERLILFVTGMTNIRDVIPYPRFPGNAEF
jgi:aspartyl/asparaginyl-tRNA synthetase